MKTVLKDADIDLIIKGVQGSYNNLNGNLNVYRSTNTSGIVSLVIEAKTFGTFIMNKDQDGIYQFANLELEDDSLSEKSQFYLLFNGIVKTHTGKDWLAHNSMSRPDNLGTFQ